MKSIKILLLALFSSAAIFTSCVSTDVVPLDDSAYLDLTFMASVADSTNTHKKMTEIDPATLPAVIKTYITTNYPGATIKHAGTTDSGKTIVHLVLADGLKNKGLVFDAAGKFLAEKTKDKDGKKGKKIEVSALPKVITDYIASKYSGGTIEKAFQSETLSYGVEVVKADKTKVMVLFDKDGKFLSELTHKEGEKKGKGPKKN
jgi:Putative beta-lactamase-inhibitor-like, PepSY-like